MAKSGKSYLCSLLMTFTIMGCFPDAQKSADAETGSNDYKYIAQGRNTGRYWPTEDWKTCSPEEVGLISQKLSDAIDYAATPKYNTEGLVVIKDSYIVAEAYFGGFRQDSKHVSYSMAKSLTSALIGIAIDQNLISGIDEKLCRYFANWDCDAEDDLRSRITIKHALTLTTGLKWHEDWTRWDPATNDALKMGASGRFVKYISDSPGLYEPGQRFNYSTGDPMLLSHVLQKATGMTAFEFAKKNIFDPLNIREVSWENDRDGYTSTSWGLYTTVRNFAKFGYLYLKNGHWEDRQIVSEQWVKKSTRTDPSVKMWQAYGYLWHVNLPLRLGVLNTDIPADGYMAEGVLGQNIVIIPSKGLLIVRVADEQNFRMDLAEFITRVLNSYIKHIE